MHRVQREAGSGDPASRVPGAMVLGAPWRSQRTVSAVEHTSSAGGDEGALEIERSWVLLGTPDLGAITLQARVHIWQCYLSSTPGADGVRVSERVRRITPLVPAGPPTYWHTRKRALESGAGEARVRHEVEEVISPTTAAALLLRADPRRQPVEKQRITFTHAGQEFTLDELSAPVRCWILEAELATAVAQPALPALGAALYEVSGVPGWSNRSLARGVLPPLPPLPGHEAPKGSEGSEPQQGA